MFWQNVWAVVTNLPLVISDTDDPRDISLNRIITLMTFLVVVAFPIVAATCFPELLDKLLGYWDKLLLFLGGQTAANIGKRYIDMKTANSAANPSQKPQRG